MDSHQFVAPTCPLNDFEIPAFQAEPARQELDEGTVGGALDRRRRHAGP